MKDFSSICNEIKQADSLSSLQRNRLLSLVNYIEKTDANILKNITPNRILEISNSSDLSDVFDAFILCNNKWHLLDPVYRYDDFPNEPIELDEDEVTEIREKGMIAVDNGNREVPFRPERLFITFKLSDYARKLKHASNSRGIL